MSKTDLFIMRARKPVVILIVCVAFLHLGLSQDIETWTDHDSVNADGDTVEIDYPQVEKSEITRLRINESKNTLLEFNESKEEVFLTYNNSLDGTENLSIGYKVENSSWKSQNIEEDLTRFKTDFLGFYKNSNRLTRQIYYRELENVRLKLNVTKTNGNSTSSVKGLLGEDFEVYSEGSQGRFELDGGSSNPYFLKFSGLPKMDPGRARFRLEMRNGPEIKQFKVQKRVPFQGQVLGQGGVAKDATFEIIDSSINKFETDDRGNFEELLEKREIDKKIKLYLGDVTTTFGGLELQSDRQEDIRYEYYKGFDPEEVKTDKLLKPLNIVGFSSNYPIDIDETKVTMNYNSSGIDPENVEFYECSYWDFLGKECRNNWERKDEVDHNKIRNEATLKDLETQGDGDYGLKSAYMAAIEYERPFLELEENLLEKTRFNVQETIALEGKIRDGKKNEWVENADIEVTLEYSQNETLNKYRGVNTSSNTNENGLFSFDPIEIPDKEGSYSLEFEASKPGFNNISFTENLEVEKTLNMSLEAASDKKLVPGETSTAVFNLENTGQTDIRNITVNETNLDPVYLTITPETINELDAGETKSITVSSILPDSYCREENCGEGLNLKVEAVSKKGVNISSSTSAEIKNTGKQGGSSVNETSKNERNQSKKDEEDQGSSNNSTNVNDTENESSSKNSEENGLDQIDIPLTDTEIKNSAEKLSNRFEETETETKLVLVALLLFAVATLKKKNDGKSRDLKINPRIDLQIGRPEKISQETNVRKDKLRKPAVNTENQVLRENIEASNDKDKEKSSESKDKGEVCPQCGENFDTPEALGIHLKTQH